jgi:hypothetical protein
MPQSAINIWNLKDISVPKHAALFRSKSGLQIHPLVTFTNFTATENGGHINEVQR